MNILAWVLIGLIAGSLAKFLMPGHDRGGWLFTLILGIVGASLGGWIGSNLLHWGAVTDFSVRSIVLAVGGAFILLLIYRMLTGRAPRV